MSYRIDYSVRGNVLRATVFGKSQFAKNIARDIGAQAASNDAGNLLIDLRTLDDRLGTLGTILGTSGGPVLADRRIAVIDVQENDPFYAFAEKLARQLRCTLRCFTDSGAAIRWLAEEELAQ